MPQPITPDLVYDLTGVSDPSMSPDGARLAFVRAKVDRDRMENRSQIMMAALSDGEPVPFTNGDTDGRPRFSPDGETIAFLRNDVKNRRQPWLIPTSGGEARQFTSAPGGVIEYAWAPDSRTLAFVSDVDPDRPPDDHDPKKDPRVRVVRRIRYRADTVGWRGDAFRHLFVLDVQSGEVRQLTDGEGEDSAPAWSPDGTRIAFISDRRDDRDVVSATEAYVVPVEGGQAELWSQGLSSVAAITWSPDGSRLAVIGSDDHQIGAGWQGWVFILESGQPPRRLTDDSIKPTAGYPPIVPAPEMRWTADGRILFLAEVRGESHLYDLSATDGSLRRVAGGGAQFGTVTFDAEARKAVVVAVPPSSPGDLRLVDVRQGTETQLTAYNGEFFGQHPTAQLEKLIVSRGGTEIESRLFLPPDFDASKRYPLVLDVHGGPHGVFYDAFNPIQQVLATNGYIVLAVNPRGSSSYGADFMTAVLGDWGGEDYLDIMAAVDEVGARPYIDASRLGITGYSYGGFMSSWIIGHDTRFRAAVVGAPCIDLSSMYGTSDIGVEFGEVQWGGMRKDVLDAYLERSPLTYAPNVETPVLLLHGEEDVRCPIEQSEQYFVALKRLGKEVEFVRFPGCSHMFLRSGHPRMRQEYLARMLAWFDRYLGVELTAAAEPQAVSADG